MTSLTLKGISKTWDKVQALKPINLDIANGEFLVLLGPSGCGKTTIMRIIAGLEVATSGTVYKDTQEITDILPRDRNMAMVFQGYALYPHMTAIDNIAYPLRAKGMDKVERLRLAKLAAEKVDLGDYLDRLPKNLSGGQRQRVALARALVRSPDVFLMDEPLSNLDAKLRGVMRVEIKRLQIETGITTLYVTHDQIEAMTLADRIVIMKAGEIKQIGTPDEIYDNPANLFVAGFLGSPPMNFITGIIKSNSFVTGEHKINAQGVADNTNVQLGVRAEDLSLVEANKSDFKVEVYSVEPTGEATLVVVKHNDELIVVKADKYFRPKIESIIGLKFSADGLRFFDKVTQARLRAI